MEKTPNHTTEALQKAQELSMHIKRAGSDHVIATETLESVVALLQLVEQRVSSSPRSQLNKVSAANIQAVATDFRNLLNAYLGQVIGGIHLEVTPVLQTEIDQLKAQHSLLNAADEDVEARKQAVAELMSRFDWQPYADTNLDTVVTDELEWMSFVAFFDWKAGQLEHQKQVLEGLFERVVKKGGDVWSTDPS